MQNFVPKLVMQLMRDVKEHEAVENKFYGAHKALDRTKHDPDVKQFARAFRAANPKITEEELFPMVAYAVMAKYGLTAQAAQAGGAAAAAGTGKWAEPTSIRACKAGRGRSAGHRIAGGEPLGGPRTRL